MSNCEIPFIFLLIVAFPLSIATTGVVGLIIATIVDARVRAAMAVISLGVGALCAVAWTLGRMIGAHFAYVCE